MAPLAGILFHVIDYDNPMNNDFVPVNQFTVVENGIERRPDSYLYKRAAIGGN